MAKPTKRTEVRRAKFLEALTEGATVSKAAKFAGFGRQTVYKWRQDDDVFAAAWDDAVESGTDKLEEEAWRRAHDGVEKPVYYQGAEVGVVREYSDTLLIFMLKGRRPEKFKDRVATEVTGKDGGPIQHEVSALDAIDAKLAAIAERRAKEQ